MNKHFLIIVFFLGIFNSDLIAQREYIVIYESGKGKCNSFDWEPDSRMLIYKIDSAIYDWEGLSLSYHDFCALYPKISKSKWLISKNSDFNINDQYLRDKKFFAIDSLLFATNNSIFLDTIRVTDSASRYVEFCYFKDSLLVKYKKFSGENEGFYLELLYTLDIMGSRNNYLKNIDGTFIENELWFVWGFGSSECIFPEETDFWLLYSDFLKKKIEEDRDKK